MKPHLVAVVTLLAPLVAGCATRPSTVAPARSASAGGECRVGTTKGKPSQILRVELAVQPDIVKVTWSLRSMPTPAGALYVEVYRKREQQPRFFAIEGDRAFVSQDGSEVGSPAKVKHVGRTIEATFFDEHLPPMFDWLAEVTANTEVVASCPLATAAAPRVHYVR